MCNLVITVIFKKSVNAGCIETTHPYLAAEVVIIINEIVIEEDLGNTFSVILGRVEYENSEWTLKAKSALHT